MKLRAEEIEWMALAFPGLVFQASEAKICGTLRVLGSYDRKSGELRWGDIRAYGSAGTYLSDSFEIAIDLSDIDRYGWPKVQEIGGRCQEIATLNNCELIDLHLFSDGTCCLGLRLNKETGLTLRRLLTELILPFFYRLSYVSLFGLKAARRDLWGEYSHGNDGKFEFIRETIIVGYPHASGSAPCPCGSGTTYKNCHGAVLWAI